MRSFNCDQSYPYYTDDQNFPFPKLNTGNSIVDDYVRTAHYLDQSLEQFFHYLQTTSLYNHSIFVIYGDHFGISDANNKDLCKAFNRDPKTWTNYDNAQLQRVPLMFYMPGYTQGKIMHEYGGEIDVLPTLYHLLGVDDKIISILARTFYLLNINKWFLLEMAIL